MSAVSNNGYNISFRAEVQAPGFNTKPRNIALLTSSISIAEDERSQSLNILILEKFLPKSTKDKSETTKTRNQSNIPPKFQLYFAGKVLDVQGKAEDKKVQSQNLATTHVSDPVIVFQYVQLAMTLLSLLHESGGLSTLCPGKGFCYKFVITMLSESITDGQYKWGLKKYMLH